MRLYSRDLVWCSLDPASTEDMEHFSDVIHQGHPPSSRTRVAIRSPTVRREPTLRVAMVFPQAKRRTKNGVPPTGGGAQRPLVPTTSSFAGESVDFVLFPEGYICATDNTRKRSLQRLASELNAPLLVGAIDKNLDASDRAWQVLLRFEPDGSTPSRIYVKHSTAEAVAFERQDWEPCEALPTFDLRGVTAGATICHDHYLGLLPRFLAKRGVQLWVNPSFDNVSDIKWSSVLRLRAVENRFFALCTLHCDVNARTRTHPFGFSPDGAELSARQAGSNLVRPLSKCNEAESIYIVELDMDVVGKPLDWSKIPPAETPTGDGNATSPKSVRIGLRSGKPAVLGRSGWKGGRSDLRVETDYGPIYVGVQPIQDPGHFCDRLRGFLSGQEGQKVKTPFFSMLLVLLASIIGSVGAVLLKAGAARLHRHSSTWLLNWRLMVGVVVALVSSYFFVLAVRQGELTVLYPLISLGYVWTLFWSRIFFREPLTPKKFLGLGLILLGTVFLALGRN